MRSFPLLAALALPLASSGCLIEPDFASDAGPTDAGTADAGTDAGATGSLGAQLSILPSGATESLAWNGSDLSQSFVDQQGATGPSEVTLIGSNTVSGNFRLTLASLIPGEATVTVLSTSYLPSAALALPDAWTCDSLSTTGCQPAVSISAYDGVTLQGNFQVSFPADVYGNTAQLTSGSFSVELQ